MPEFSTFSTRGVEQIHAAGTAVIDLRGAWPTRETLLDGEPGPVWDVDAPLDAPITTVVRAPAGDLTAEVTTIRLLIGQDGGLSVVGLTRSFPDHDRAAQELLRTAVVAGLPQGRAEALARRIATGDPERRDRQTLNGGSDLGVRVSVTAHRLTARGDVPALDVLEWSVSPGEGDDGWLRP